jgi:hypothetical protein
LVLRPSPDNTGIRRSFFEVKQQLGWHRQAFLTTLAGVGGVHPAKQTFGPMPQHRTSMRSGFSGYTVLRLPEDQTVMQGPFERDALP